MKWRSVLAAVVLTLLAPPLPAQRQSSLTRLPSRLAVFAVPLADANELTAVASALEVVGVGFETTSELEVALQAPLVVLAGTLTNKALSAAERERLYAYVEAGGVLFASHVQGNQFFPLFGLAAFATSRENFRLRFVAAEADPVLRFLNQPEEQEIRFGDPGRFEEVDWTSEYTLGRAQALGHYPNGAVGFMRNYYGRGVAYSLGISFADSTLRPALGQSYEAQPQWVNVFAPSADV
ncbi:MAG: hypothetical protein ACE5HB_06655, partial [Terriglobia bacterium]